MMRPLTPIEVSLEASTSNFEKQDSLALQVLQLNGIVPVLKVTRAGATTSLIKQAVNAGKKVVIVELTYRIGDYTVTR